jgi:hypothetical protein
MSDNTVIVNRTGFVAAMDQITFSETEYQTKQRMLTILGTAETASVPTCIWEEGESY